MRREKGLRRYLGVYLGKLKKTAQGEPREEISAINKTASWLLSACKYPRTSSFAGERNPAPGGRDTSATLADVDRFLFDNFNSLYNVREEENPSVCTSTASASSSTAMANPSPHQAPPPPPPPFLMEQSVAVMTYSKDPYEDFRRSLQEMVDAHEEGRDSLDWDFMEELLISYLELNDRAVHKHVLRAFADVAVSFRGEKDVVGVRRRRRNQTGRPLKSLDSAQLADGNPSSLTCK